MATVRGIYGAAPFDEAVEFFRKKLNMPSNRWDDLWKEQHAKGFMVAGATKAELLADLRSAVDAAIAKGESLQDFRSRFDDIIAKHGWQAKGNRNWRTKVIYNTNLRTAYMAGRYQQMKDPDVVKLRPYWQYLHGDSRYPRPHHLSWHKLVLRHDDPWWDTHYTPNGWGCKCRVRSLSQRDMERKGLTLGNAPDDGVYEWKDRAGNIHKIPTGIDPGWDYNVGKASELGRTGTLFMEKLTLLPPQIGAAMAAEFPEIAKIAFAEEIRAWIQDIQAGNVSKAGGNRVVGATSLTTVYKLKDIGVELESAAITLEQRSVNHLLAEERKGSKAIPEALVPEIAALLQSPDAVVWDSKGKRPALLYVVSIPVEGKVGKIVVRVNFKKGKSLSNAIRSAGALLPQDLKKPGMILLEGKIE